MIGQKVSLDSAATLRRRAIRMLGAVWSKVASLPPRSSNFCLNCSGVYFLPLLPGTTAPEEPGWVVDCGKMQSGSVALVSALDSWVLGFISA